MIPLNKYSIMFLTIVIWAIATYESLQAIDFYKQMKAPLVEGKIVAAEKIKNAQYNLKIQIDDGTVVNAIVRSGFAEKLPSPDCKVYYDAINKSDVLMEGEENPLQLAGILAIGGTLLPLFYFILLPWLDKKEIFNQPISKLITAENTTDGNTTDTDTDTDKTNNEASSSHLANEIKPKRIGAVVLLTVIGLIGFWWNRHLIYSQGQYYVNVALISPALIVLAIYFAIFPEDPTVMPKMSLRLGIVYLLCFILGFINLYALKNLLY